MSEYIGQEFTFYLLMIASTKGCFQNRYHSLIKMKSENSNRRKFLKTVGTLSLLSSTGPISAESFPVEPGSTSAAPLIEMTSLAPDKVFDVIDLSHPGLEAVKSVLENSGHEAALAALLSYYRKKFPLASSSSIKKPEKPDPAVVNRADNLETPLFQWGPYPPAKYPSPIDWAFDPAHDIEWVASIYRFSWVGDLVKAYQLTGDSRYVQTFVNLTSDWIRKHPLEKTLQSVHPVYTYWKGYPWLDLQTGIRATQISAGFRNFVHSELITPEFLGILLASMYDHQHKTELLPMNSVHNKAVFEQRGFVNVIYTFRVFKDATRWLDLALERTTENLLAQTTTDGVQKEWCGGYHLGVYRDILEIEERYRQMGKAVSTSYRARLRAMAEHIFWLSTPDLSFPMFGDTSRYSSVPSDRKKLSLYPVLTEAASRFNDAKFAALADLNPSKLPRNASKAFPEAGIYVMRRGWDAQQIYMALHCSPPGISTHDTADNGTFELYAYGRWLMPDSGYFVYGRNNADRDWHRQTKVHATLTVNGKDTQQIGRQLGWVSGDNHDMLCVENQSYQYFTHRRTIWFAGKNTPTPYIVMVDEAIGDLKGDIEIHFPMAPGSVHIDQSSGRISTEFPDVNLLIQVAGKSALKLQESAGWTSSSYGKRERRTAVSAVHSGQGPFVFVSILMPYRGQKAPDIQLITDPRKIMAGDKDMEIRVQIQGKTQQLIRKI